MAVAIDPLRCACRSAGLIREPVAITSRMELATEVCDSGGGPGENGGLVGSSRPTSQFLRNTDEIAATLSELRCKHADARSVPKSVDGVEDVHYIEADRDRLAIGLLDLMRDADTGRGIGCDMIGIGKAAAQATAVDHAGAEAGAVPEVGRPSRAGPLLRVIGVDVMGGDIGELVGAE